MVFNKTSLVATMVPAFIGPAGVMTNCIALGVCAVSRSFACLVGTQVAVNRDTVGVDIILGIDFMRRTGVCCIVVVVGPFCIVLI